MSLPDITLAEINSFIDKVGAFAVSEMIRTSMLGTPVLASYTIAQACLESFYGKLPVNGGYFGVKGSGGSFETTEFVNGKWITVTASFQSYDSIEASVIGHSQFLIENPRYTRNGLFKAGVLRDWNTACWALQNAGYATDPKYAELLIGIIEARNLTRFDKEADADMKALEQLQAAYLKLEGDNKMILNTLEAHIEEINKLKEKTVMSEIPDWAKEATEAAVKSGIVDTAKGGSFDFYRVLTVLHRNKMF